MNGWFRSGGAWIWLTGGAVGLCLVATLGLGALLAGQAVRIFWPQPLYQFQLTAPDCCEQRMLGEIYARETRPSGKEADRGTWLIINTGKAAEQASFIAIPESRIVKQSRSPDLLVVKRFSSGNEYGVLAGMREDGQPLTADNMPRALQQRLDLIDTHRRLAASLREEQRGQLALRAQQLQLQADEWKRQGQWTARNQARTQASEVELQRRYDQLSQQLSALENELDRDTLLLRDGQGVIQAINMSDIEQAWYPNRMSFAAKARHAVKQIVAFVSPANPADSLQTGAFPAIVGTVLLVMLMSVIVMPLGVMAAVYLHEYADNNALTRFIRIAVGNLAGVPSIVYGVFGLGFFVYIVGGSLDSLFYADQLPSPTFGTPGLLWASLTLALLTLPVVIIATEEGLSRVPPSLRHGSLALGATQAETLWRVVLPGAAPAMMTGLILAVARAAGETAPLMLVGVIKSAPLLPVDGIFPWLHPDRKFMHLGFQIYDLAFQNPDSNAARPLVFATALLLIIIVVSLNLAAIGLRHHLREKFRTLSL